MTDADPARTGTPVVSTLTVLSALVIGAIIGGMAVEYWFVKHAVATPAAQTAAPSPGLAADVAQLKKVVPVQSHTMQDVGYHWANLWFAAEKKNWPLATYFFNEARQAVRWTVLIRPVRQLPGGGTVDIKGIFDSINPTAFATVQLAIEDEDSAAFVTAYKQALTACQSCHASAGLPFLRPTVPTAPSATILSFER
jgi:hypothetical protein